MSPANANEPERRIESIPFFTSRTATHFPCVNTKGFAGLQRAAWLIALFTVVLASDQDAIFDFRFSYG